MFKVSLSLWLLMACSSTLAGSSPQDIEVRAILLKQHCQQCHGAEKPKGKFRVDSLALDLSDRVSRDQWLNVLNRVQAGEMPPKGMARPPEKDSAALPRASLKSLFAGQRQA